MEATRQSWLGRLFQARAATQTVQAAPGESDPDVGAAAAAAVAAAEAARREQSQLLTDVRTSVEHLGTLSGKLAESGVTALSVTSEIASNLSNGTEQAASASAQARAIADLAASTARSTAEFRSFISDANAVMQDLAKRATEIGTVRDEIAQIAAQTRFLALNAQIEAARAGQQGVPFGVIASEVGKLSTKVMSASTVISDRLGQVAESLASSADVVTRIDRMVNELEERTRETAMASTELSAVIARVDSTIGGINSNFEHVVNNCFADIIENSMEVQSDAQRISGRLA